MAALWLVTQRTVLGHNSVGVSSGTECWPRRCDKPLSRTRWQTDCWLQLHQLQLYAGTSCAGPAGRLFDITTACSALLCPPMLQLIAVTLVLVGMQAALLNDVNVQEIHICAGYKMVRIYMEPACRIGNALAATDPWMM